MSEDKPRGGRSRLRTIMGYAVALVVLAGVFIGVEGAAALMNRAAGEGVWPVLFDVKEFLRARGTVEQVGRTQTLGYVDPHLGYGHEHAVLERLGDAMLPGFVIYGDTSDASAMRIVALGGSTTDPTDKENWPRKLHGLLKQRGTPNVVFNGGVSGYSSNQELLKLLRDVLPLKPDVVISLSGINDAGFTHSLPGHPMVNPYQERMLMELTAQRSPILMPNTMRAWQRWRMERSSKAYRIGGVNYGPRVETMDGEQWARNVRLMHTICRENGVRFVCGLQPVLGVGEYTASTREAELLAEAGGMFGGLYREKLSAFYAQARAAAEPLDYVVDLVDLYAPHGEMYRDARHPNAQGYSLIAEAFVQELVDAP